VEEREREKEKERERERDRASLVKEELDAAASRRRKLKREHIPGVEPGEYSPVAPPPPSSLGMSQTYDGRERGDRKVSMVQRPGFFEESSMRMHVKEQTSKMARRDVDPYPLIFFLVAFSRFTRR